MKNKTPKKTTREEILALALQDAGAKMLWSKELETSEPSQMLAWSLRGGTVLMQVWPRYDAVELYWPSKSRTIGGLIREIKQEG